MYDVNVDVFKQMTCVIQWRIWDLFGGGGKAQGCVCVGGGGGGGSRRPHNLRRW